MSPVKELLEGLKKAKEQKGKGLGRKVYAIASVEDFKRIENQVMGAFIVNRRLTYFALVVADDSGFSNCYFTPTSQTREKEMVLFVGDYEKIVRLLLSHPKVRHIEYDPEGPCISAVFEDPYPFQEPDYEEI